MVTKKVNYVEEIIALIEQEQNNEVLKENLDHYHENDIAAALEFLTSVQRETLYTVLKGDKISDIFSYLENPAPYFAEMELAETVHIIENMDSDDAVDILETLDEDVCEAVVSLLDKESSEDIRLIQSYDEEEIGSKMTTNFIMIQKGITIKQAMKELVAQAKDNDNIYTIYICDENDCFYGALDLKDLIIAREHTDLKTLISHSYPWVNDHEKVSDCLEKIKDYAEDSIPVLNEKKQILGVITSQDIIEAVDEELGDDYAKLAGLTEEEDLNETAKDSIKKRLPWLVALLVLGMLVSSVVGLFEAVVAEVAIVICFQSLILDMAGNVGTQSLAVTIRVLMDEDLKASQKAQLVVKEMKVGFLNGLLLGGASILIVGLYIWKIKKHLPVYAFTVSGCVGIALMIAMLISSMVGTLIPMFFHKIHIDPAVASGPLITTINDLIAVIVYYGLVWLLMLQILHL